MEQERCSNGGDSKEAVFARLTPTNRVGEAQLARNVPMPLYPQTAVSCWLGRLGDLGMNSEVFGRQESPVVLAPPSVSRPQDPLSRAYDLPCTLVLEVPAVDFTVGSLMRLKVGTIVRTAAQHNEDLTLKVNGQIVGLVEFDVIGDRLAVRLTGVA